MPRVGGEKKYITKNLFHKSQQQLAVLSASTSLPSSASASIQQHYNTVTIYRSNNNNNNISNNKYTNSSNNIQAFHSQQQQQQQQQQQHQQQQQQQEQQNHPQPHLHHTQQNANNQLVVVQTTTPSPAGTLPTIVSAVGTSAVSGTIRYHGKAYVADSSPIGVRCGRREWNAAQSLVKLNGEDIRTTTTTAIQTATATTIKVTPKIEVGLLSSSTATATSSTTTQSATTTGSTKSTSSGPVSPTEGSVAPIYYTSSSNSNINITMDTKTEISSNRQNVSSSSNASLERRTEIDKREILGPSIAIAVTEVTKNARRVIKPEGTPEQVIFYAPPAAGSNQSEKQFKQEPPPPPPQYPHLNPLYRERSIEETEAAHDLLSLSQSLPPLPAPCVVTIHPQEESSHYVETTPVMQEISNSSNYIANSHSNERISVRVEVDSDKTLSSNHQHHIGTHQHHSHHNQPNRFNSYENNTENCSPLTPPTSEHSSDIEVDMSATDSAKSINKLQHDDLWNPELAKVKKEKIFIIDGRSKNRKPDAKKPSKSRKGSYKCSECGRAYATSSNLSRHKQTHRSLDSQSAKKCNTCGKAYVSMPALAMHLLTHKLTHSCGICGKLFSRPWLLQGHLRSHTGEKPYVCAHCGKAFADRSNLRAHMQTHSSSKKYKCPKCLKTFALKSYLNKHLESACYNDKDFLVSSDDNEEDIVVT